MSIFIEWIRDCAIKTGIRAIFCQFKSILKRAEPDRTWVSAKDSSQIAIGEI